MTSAKRVKGSLTERKPKEGDHIGTAQDSRKSKDRKSKLDMAVTHLSTTYNANRAGGVVS